MDKQELLKKFLELEKISENLRIGINKYIYVDSVLKYSDILSNIFQTYYVDDKIYTRLSNNIFISEFKKYSTNPEMFKSSKIFQGIKLNDLIDKYQDDLEELSIDLKLVDKNKNDNTFTLTFDKDGIYQLNNSVGKNIGCDFIYSLKSELDKCLTKMLINHGITRNKQ